MPPKGTSFDAGKNAKVVYIQGYPPRVEAACIYKSSFSAEEVRDEVIEIATTIRNDAGVAWVEFNSAEAAQRAVKALDGAQNSVDRILTATLSKAVPPTKGLVRLSDWKKQQEAMEPSRTVEISNLNTEDTHSSLDTLMAEAESHNDEAEDPEDAFDIEHLEVTGPGTAIVQFAAEYTARLMVGGYGGAYWQDRTIYVKFVPDSTMHRVSAAINKDKSASKKESEQLAAANANHQAMDKMETPSDAGSPTDAEDLANRLSSLHVKMESVDVRVDNLAYSATKEDVRKAFGKKELEVTKVVLKDGFAWVGLPSKGDAKKAVRVMTGRRIKGRALAVEMARKE